MNIKSANILYASIANPWKHPCLVAVHVSYDILCVHHEQVCFEICWIFLWDCNQALIHLLHLLIKCSITMLSILTMMSIITVAITAQPSISINSTVAALLF